MKKTGGIMAYSSLLHWGGSHGHITRSMISRTRYSKVIRLHSNAVLLGIVFEEVCAKISTRFLLDRHRVRGWRHW